MRRWVPLAILLALFVIPTMQVTRAQSGNDPYQNVNALVVLDARDKATPRQAVALIESQGGHITHVLPPRVLLGRFPSTLDTALTGLAILPNATHMSPNPRLLTETVLDFLLRQTSPSDTA